MHIYILIGRAQGQGVLCSIISDEIESSGHCEYIYANDALIANKKFNESGKQPFNSYL